MLIFNVCFTIDSFQRGHYVMAAIVAAMLFYIAPRYIKFLLRNRV